MTKNKHIATIGNLAMLLLLLLSFSKTLSLDAFFESHALINCNSEISTEDKKDHAFNLMDVIDESEELDDVEEHCESIHSCISTPKIDFSSYDASKNRWGSYYHCKAFHASSIKSQYKFLEYRKLRIFC